MAKRAGRFKPHNCLVVNKWSVAIYVRLSDEDKGKKKKTDLSQSIQNQTDLLNTFLDSINTDEAEPYKAKLHKVYCDDDFTGMNFNRKGFQMMLADIKAGKVDCIIVKNLSRLGRYDTEMQKYLEQEFEQNGREVRVIAIGDNFDSLYMEVDIITKFKLLMNRDYSETQHKNVSLAMHTMQRQGKFVGAFAPYGYEKDKENKHHLVVDPPAAAVVKRIYSLYIAGLSPKEIARILTEVDHVVNPATYKKNHGSNFQCGKKISDAETHWRGDGVKKILMDEVYTGTLVQHKQEKKKLIDECPTLLPKEEWIRCYDTHKAIISREAWEAVQSMMKTVKHDATKVDEVTIFKGILKCGDCHHAMRKKWDKHEKEDGTISKYLYYNCGTFRDYGKDKCGSHYISDKVIRKIVLSDINAIISRLQNLEKVVRTQKGQGNSGVKAAELSLAANENRKNVLNNRKKTAKNKWLDGLMSDADYKETIKDYDSQIEALEAENKLLRKSMQKPASVLENQWVQNLLSKGKLTELDRATVVELVDKIYVYQNHTLEIVYRFSDEFDYLFQTSV